MPKQIYPLRDFSGGLNSLKDPSDIANNELSHAQNIMFTKQGAIDPGLNMRNSTHNKLSAISNTQIDHIVGGYGLGYFETDHYADGGATSFFGEEIITATVDRTIASGTINWVEYSPSTTLATYTEDTTTDDRIEIVGTSSTNKEGAELGIAYMGYITPGRIYRVSAKVVSLSGSISGFKFEIGGAASSAFAISTSTDVITKDIEATGDEPLRIYYENSSTTGWSIDDISVKEMSSRGLTLTGSSADHGFLFTSDGMQNYVYARSDGTAKVNVTDENVAADTTVINLHSGWFPTGTEVSLSGMNTNYLSQVITSGDMDGIYTVVGGNGGDTIYLDRDTPPQVATALGGTAVGDTLISVAGTITGIPSGDKVLLVANPSSHSIDVYSNSGGAYLHNKITLQDYTTDNENSEILYYKVDEAIRCCDTNIYTQCKIQWYGWISIEHFVDSTAKATHSGYFAKDNKLSPPTTTSAIKYFNDITDTLTYPAAGKGFTLICGSSATDGLIPGATYEFAQSFIYDGNQESLLSRYAINDTTLASDRDTTLAHTDLKQLSIQIGAQGDYDERVSGGRIYIREYGTEDEWTFLLDISLSKGARTNLEGKYTSWKLASGDNHYIGSAVDTFMSINELNLLNYEIINGFPSNVFSNDLGGHGEKWQDSTVANNRVFVCNVRMSDKNKGENKIEGHAHKADLSHFPDRIMYSMPHRYDTFPEINTIEAAKGDADYYMAIESYADRLLAFKRKSMDIINISGESHNWFLEDTKQYVGVEHHAAVQRTQYGIIWVNFNGLFLYDGTTIKDLTENKIDDKEWYSFVTSSSIILYDEIKSLVFVVKSCINNGDAYAVDLKKSNFTFLSDFAQDGITNPVPTNISSNGQILVGYDAGSQLDFYHFYINGQEQQQVEFETKELDFDIPNKQKKLYAVYITYKSNADISAKFKYSIDGGANWVAFSSGSSATSTTIWQKGKWSLTTPAVSSKFMLQLDATTTSATVWINDISFEYRTMHKKDG